MKKVPVAVVGIGKLGEAHLRHLVSLPGAQVVGVFDQDGERLKEISGKYEVHQFNSVDEIWKHAEAVSVVVSTTSHYAIAKSAMEHGLHVFIEKPMTTSLQEADELLALHRKKGGIVQIGLIERFNPAFAVLKQISIQPRYIESQRLAPFTQRGADASVVLDLMIHDIDIILTLLNSCVERVDAQGFSVISDSIDFANARLQFQNGAVANLTASRIAADKVRMMHLHQCDSRITIDFLKKETEIVRFADSTANADGETVIGQLDFKGRKRFLLRHSLEVPFVDALQAELRAFIDAIQGNAPPVVSAEEGRNALAVSLAIMDALREK